MDPLGVVVSIEGSPSNNLSTWLNGATAFVTTWYDQSGGNRHITVGNGQQTLDVSSDMASIGFDGTTGHMQQTDFYQANATNPIFLGKPPSSANNWNGSCTYIMVVNPSLLDGTGRSIITDNNYNEGMVRLRNTGIQKEWGSGINSTWSSTLTENKWYHIALTHRERINDAYACELYVDGVLRLSTTSGSTSSSYGPDARLVIGYLFQGLYADLTIYDRVLTASEINIVKDTRANLFT